MQPSCELTRQSYRNSSDLFDWFLDLEKRRRLRTGGCVCVVAIDFSDFVESYRASDSSFQAEEFWERTIKLILRNIRDTDVFFKLDGTVKIILTDTAKQGAYTVARRLFTVMQSLEYQNEFSNPQHGIEVRVLVWDYSAKMKYSAILHQKEGIEPWKRMSMNS